MTVNVCRRNFIVAAAALLSVGLPVRSAQATPEALGRIMSDRFGKRPMAPGKVLFDMSAISEDGSSVLCGVAVESPMTDTDFCKSLSLFAEENPAPEIVTFQFSPLAGKVELVTRIRLAKSQNVIAVAEMNDGSLYTATKYIKVTIGGCGGSN